MEYVPVNEQENRDLCLLIEALGFPKVFTRENEFMHFTASGWVVNKEHTKVLMAYHKIYDSYAWLGGHADGEEDLLKVAMKEVREESGLVHLTPLSEHPVSVEVLTVDGHVKRGKYVSSHLHLNVTYLIEADEHEPLKVKEDENSALQWFSLEDALKASSEPWFVENIYKKLNERVVACESNTSRN